MRLILLGFGYSARHFVHRFGKRFSYVGATWRTADTRRMLDGAGIEPLAIDAELGRAVSAADIVLVSAGPDAAGDPFLPLLRPVHGPRRWLYLSTVGVYGNHDGGWVDETTPLRPVSQRSRWRVAAEEQWLRFGEEAGAAVHILRLAGIYGPGRNALDNLRAGTARRIVKPGQVFNRIHVADIAGACMALADAGGQGTIWNITDDLPAPPQDVVVEAARLLGVEPPPETPFNPANMTPMAASFYGENKRVSNRKLRDLPGLRLLYPTYREGLAAIAAQAATDADSAFSSV